MKTAYQLVSVPPNPDATQPIIVAGERYTYRLSRVVIRLTIGTGPITPVLFVRDGASNICGAFIGGALSATLGQGTIQFAPGILPNPDQALGPNLPGAGEGITNGLGIFVNVPIPTDILIEEGMAWEIHLDGATVPGSGGDVVNTIVYTRFVDPTG